MRIRDLFRRAKIVDALKNFGALRFRVSHSALMQISLLSIILFIAFMIRLLPLRWGFHLSEFDPYFQYRLGKYMVDNGFFAWLSWHDSMRWYPYGVNIGNSFPGLSGTAAFFYLILRGLGLSPTPMVTSNPLTTDPFFNFCILFPVIMGTLTCLVMYLLGKDIGGKEMGLFSALFLALNSSYISRTSLGFFDDETVGIFGILLFIFFFLRAIEPERSLRNGLTYAVTAGLSLGYIFISWGAALYPLGMTVLFVFVLVLLRRYSSRLLLSYSASFGIALFIAINLPKLGFKFLTEPYVLAVVGIFLLLCLFEASRHIRTLRMKTIFTLGFLGAITIFFLALSWSGFISQIPFKWLTIIDPFTRGATGSGPVLIQSVQEHRPAAWGTFYFDLGIGALFVPIGLFFAIQNPTNRNLLLSIFSLTSVYFASSMVRLTLLMAPSLSLLWALALVQLLGPFITIMKEAPVTPRRKMRVGAHVGKEFSAAFIVMTLLLLTFTFVLPSPNAAFPRAFSHAYSPTTIAAASLPMSPSSPVTDWLDTVNWMRYNLPPSPPDGPTVVACWWDYGYWITIMANRTTLADNGTVNGTQIALIGKMFMSNETEAIEILDAFDATHVVVFTTFTSDGNDVGYADEGKWVWMARIPGLDDKSFGNVTLGTDWVDVNGDGSYRNADGTTQTNELIANAKGQNTVLYKLMRYGKEATLGQTPTVQLTYFEKAYFSQAAGAPKQYGSVIPLVAVYTINYG